MPSRDPSAPPRWEVNPSAPGQRAPVVALGLVGLTISLACTLHRYGVIDTLWEPLPAVTADGWIRSAVAAPWPTLDAAGFAATSATALVGGRDRWRRSPTLALVSGGAAVLTAIAALVRWTWQYAVLGTTSTLFFFSTATAVALLPLVADEVYAAAAGPDRLARRRVGSRIGDGITYLGGGGAVAIGLFLLAAPLAPWSRAALHAHLVGGLVAAIGALTLARVTRSARWLNAGIGTWLLISPLVAGYTLRGALHMVITGLLLLVLSIAFEDPEAARGPALPQRNPPPARA